MGIICAVTPGTKPTNVISRAQTPLTNITTSNRIPIVYHKANALTRDLKYSAYLQFDYNDPTAMLDVIWQTALLFKPKRPLWNSMMQHVQNGDHPGKSSVVFLPMIDLKPSDMTYEVSTLWYIVKHAARYGVTPIVTFDQPLWWKAMIAIESEPSDSDLEIRRVQQ